MLHEDTDRMNKWADKCQVKFDIDCEVIYVLRATMQVLNCVQEQRDMVYMF